MQIYLLVSLNITRKIVNVWKSNLSKYLLAEFLQEHILALQELETFQPNEVIYSAL